MIVAIHLFVSMTITVATLWSLILVSTASTSVKKLTNIIIDLNMFTSHIGPLYSPPFFQKDYIQNDQQNEPWKLSRARHSWPSDPTRSCLSEYVFVYVCLWFVFEFVLWIVFVFYIYVCPPWVGLVVIPPGAVSPSQHVMTGCTRKLSKARLLLTAHDTLRIYHVSHVIFYLCLSFVKLHHYCRKS